MLNASEPMERDSLKISVVVPAYNSAGTLPACLTALQKQTRCPDEIIVVDDGSTDETVTVAQSSGARVLQKSHAGPAAARNLGARAAQGAIILFTDSDCEPHADWVEQMLKPFADPRVMGVKGTYDSRQRELIARLVQLEFEDKYARMRRQETIDFIDTYSAAYRREIFIRMGGFNETFPTASVEDIEFSFRLSKHQVRLVFAPQAQVLHTHPVNLTQYLARKARYAYWRALVYLWHPGKIGGDSHTDPVLKIQFALVGLTGVSILAAFLSLYGLWLALLFVGMLVATTLPFALRVCQRDRGVAWIAPPVHTLRAIIQAGMLAIGLFAHGILRRDHVTTLAGTSC